MAKGVPIFFALKYGLLLFLSLAFCAALNQIFEASGKGIAQIFRQLRKLYAGFVEQNLMKH